MASTNNQSSKGPGRAYRKGISLIQLAQMFPNDAAAEKWFQDGRWPGGLETTWMLPVLSVWRLKPA